MRRLVLPPMLATLALTACVGISGPRAPLASTALAPAPGIEEATARAAAIGFIQAYAQAPRDGGRALSAAVDGPLLSEWAHWLAVQNSHFPGSIEGAATITSVGVPSTLDPSKSGSDQPEVLLDVQASVSFTYSPAAGASPPPPQVRSLNGPMLLAEVGPGEWRVRDFTRDGTPLDLTMFVYTGLSTAKQGVTVRLANVILAGSVWQFGLVVENGTSGPIHLDTSVTAMVLDGTPVTGRAQTTFGTIEPGTTVEGFVSLPAPQGPGQPAVFLRFVGAGGLIDLGMPFQDPRQVLASPSPSGALG
ncbi:MAG: hypothetical protein HY240_02990 [Actinobacteria bacterium]|nr:hypothetical protein [Actinomycetota bacterium]